MSYEAGAAKYFLMAFVFPINYYIFGGTLLWALDILDLIGADNAQEFAVAYVMMEYGIPSSIEDAVLQLVVGAAVATLLWYVAVTRRR